MLQDGGRSKTVMHVSKRFRSRSGRVARWRPACPRLTPVDSDGRIEWRFGFGVSNEESEEVRKMNTLLERLEKEVSGWPNVSVHPHRFSAREFRFHRAEVGHVHMGGIVDIPFPRPIRDALLDEGLAEEHRWVPNSGWITFCVRTEQDLEHALWLLRLSYVRYALKADDSPRSMLMQESENLHLSPRFVSLLEQLTPGVATRLSH